MLCTRTFAPALFNSNEKCKRIRHVPKCKSKPFLAFTIIILLLRLESKYSETNKKINATDIKLCTTANLQKYRLVVHSDCHMNVANLRASWLCFLEQSKATYMSTTAKIPYCQACTPKTKKKVNQKCKSKQRITYHPSPATAPKFG